MPFSDTSIPGRYLLGLLADGAQPFAYRSGVHRLLGLPEQKTHPMRFPMRLPPVGFQYEQRGLAAPFAGSSLLSPVGMASSPPRRVEVAADVPEDATSQGREAQASPRRGSSSTPEELSPWQGPRLEPTSSSTPEELPPSLLPQRVRAAAEVSRGVAGKGRDLQALPRAEPTPSSAPQRLLPGSASPLMLSPRQEAIGPRSEPPMPLSTDPALVGRARVQTGIDTAAVAEPVPPGPLARPEIARQFGLEIPGITQRRMLFTALSRKSNAAPVQPSAPQALPKPRLGAGAPTQDTEALPTVRPSSSNHPDGISSPLAPRPSSKTEAPQFRSRKQGVEEVEHLRQVVTTLVARQAAARAERHREAPVSQPVPTSQPAPPQKVIIVRPAPAEVPRVPRAFWASSTLRSIHLRTLR